MQDRRYSSPLVYFFLVLPWGISGGFVAVTLPFVLAGRGWSVAAIGALVAIGASSNLWRFAWSPLVDLTLSTRKWYLLGIVSASASVAMFAAIPPREGWFFTTLVFFSQLASTIIVLPVAGMIAHTVRETDQGRASGWYQAGNLGGAGIGGGIGVWLAAHSTYALSCTVLALIMLTCAVAVCFVPDVHTIPGERVSVRLKAFGRDFFALIRSRRALFVVALVSSPIGVGAVVWSAVASDWRASADTVALVTGTLGGVVGAVGCVVGGWLCDRIGRFKVYFGSGVLLVVTGILMAAVPHTPNAYCAGVLTYALMTGASFGAFTALVLFTVGKGAASGKYAILASLGNLPVVYMTALDGWAHDYWNASGMLYSEAILAAFVIVLGLIGLHVILGSDLSYVENPGTSTNFTRFDWSQCHLPSSCNTSPSQTTVPL
jgi:PAT family beta-lactamase induction signal transducer AmpG